MRVLRLLATMAMCLAAVPASAQGGRLERVQVPTARFEAALVGPASARAATVYLPEGYDGSSTRYPVLYYLPNAFETDRNLFDEYGAKAVLDRAIADGVIPPVVLIAADFSTPLAGSFYASSPVTGDWEGFLAEDLPRFVDVRYRTLTRPESRGLLGDRMGGYGALRTVLLRPGVFGAAYALHPIGAGVGVQPMHSRPNFEALAGARALSDLDDDGFSRIFLAMYQAFLPNPDAPPLYADLPARRENGRLVVDAERTAQLQNAFLLDRLLPDHASALTALRGLKFDWGRQDPVQDHIVSNRALSHLLDEYGIPHEAEEYRGGWGDRHWTADGRVRTDVLPFFAAHLDFGS